VLTRHWPRPKGPLCGHRDDPPSKRPKREPPPFRRGRPATRTFPSGRDGKDPSRSPEDRVPVCPFKLARSNPEGFPIASEGPPRVSPRRCLSRTLVLYPFESSAAHKRWTRWREPPPRRRRHFASRPSRGNGGANGDGEGEGVRPAAWKDARGTS